LNGKRTLVALAATLLFASLGTGAVQANQIPGEVVTGRVTSISGDEWINVDGHNYRVKSGSAAAAALANLKPGQMVDVQLNGPASTAASEVINVIPHQGK